MILARRWLAVALCAVSLSGCGYLYDPQGFSSAISPWENGQASDQAMLALSKGHFDTAEQLGAEALRRNPRDPYALLVMASVYQNTARTDLARQYYEALISMHPQQTTVWGSGADMRRRTIEDIARSNLAALGGAAAPGMMADIAGTPAAAYAPPSSEPPQVSVQDAAFAADTAIITRFETLRRLLKMNMISRDDYVRRRAANLGALLPYSVPRRPGAGLDQPAPPAEQIIGRLKDISANYQEKSVSEDAMAAERSAILEALLPLHPLRLADSPPPVSDQLRFAAVAGRVQRLRDAGLITAAEAARERGAAEAQLAAAMAQAGATARLANGTAPQPALSAKGDGVTLGVYVSDMRAEVAWESLQRRFPEQLGQLQSSIIRVRHRRRGHVYVLRAGPVRDRHAALEVCHVLRRSHVTCAPTVIR